MTLLELSVEYRAQAQALRARIARLEGLMEEAGTEEERLLLCARRRPLRVMWREARDLSVLTAHYYERGYHRSGRYTV